jgi:hypothetical protein
VRVRGTDCDGSDERVYESKQPTERALSSRSERKRPAETPSLAVRDAARRDGVIRRLDENFTRSYVDAQLRARRWQSPVAPIVVMHNGPLTEAQQTWVSLLAAPPGAVVGGISAAILDGLAGFRPDALTVVAPGSSRNHVARIIGACSWPTQLRWSTKLGPEDVDREAMPPRTRLPRSVIDAASERVAPKRARVLILAAIQQGLTTPPVLWDSLSRRGRCRNRAIIAESIVDATGGIESLPEGEYNSILTQRGLPQPARQAPLSRPDGRLYLDNDWPAFGVRAEIHGIPHLRAEGWDQDLFRQNEIMIARGSLLVFSSYAIRHEPRRVGDQTEALLRRHGWRG